MIYGPEELKELLRKSQLALRHALTSSLGPNMVPTRDNAKDTQAVAIYWEIDKFLGDK